MIGAAAIPLLLLLAATALGAAALVTDRPTPSPAPGLRAFLREMHSTWSPGILIGAILAATCMLALAIGLALNDWPLGALAGLFAGPLAILSLLRLHQSRYRVRFRRAFLPALDIIVRGLRSGMPLTTALQVVHKEIGGPVRLEFRRLLDDLSLGLPLSQSVERMADRIPTTEVQFFAALIAFQTRTGGRLSEALENLAGTLRARDQLDHRIRTVSQEARTSALIIAVLPGFVMLGLFLLNPDYISLLFTDPLGQTVLAASALWMGFGAWTMKRMTVINV